MKQSKNIYFIAIGGSAMHNLAIALHLSGNSVSGSDDEIFNPSKGRLEKYGLLPDKMGWDESRISNEIDIVILGMHARENNPELIKAQELGLPIFSYPEYIYEATKEKTRVVIGGSHGKTTITSMVLHVLNFHKKENDYMVGAQLEGFEVMVKLTDSAEIAVLEGDEYLSSPIDRRPKFHLYNPNVALLTGIAWDHINVFPTFENYCEQFEIFINKIEEGGSLVYFSGDKEIEKLVSNSKRNIDFIPYSTPEYTIDNGVTTLISNEGSYPLEIFGEHNLQNLNGARLVCEQIGISSKEFYSAIQTFTGASKRLETITKNDKTHILKDFAHSPSKLQATTKAVKNQYPDRELIACIELHTFSSLNQEFLSEYKNTMLDADKAFVYFSPKAIEHKKLAMLSENDVKNAFFSENVTVFTNSDELMKTVKSINFENKNLLLMSSGNFDGVDFEELGNELINR
ncbi:MAG: Mur ligase family protein [Flavobacteriales bacterium]|jgi:UDP-N-acetylmuramate: L-alanyl-gamma-D-glutamyl-meso-diaminopimelate ligase|nr:Mur ligase family protein [Flavobacteriales bacterium]|tara:strand:+ start:36 stop:1409 length:1374 start_codon:yes stop_codon:yes gene_type:complete